MFLQLKSWMTFLFLLKSISGSENISFDLSMGFYCLYCREFFPENYHKIRPTVDERLADCIEPFHIFCSSIESIGCLKHVRLRGYRVETYRNCFYTKFLSALESNDVECQPMYRPLRYPLTDRVFCCNSSDSCNLSNSIYSSWNIHITLLIHLFLLLLYHKHLCDCLLFK